jgi:hypothetical protein
VTDLPPALRIATAKHCLATVIIPLAAILAGAWMMASRPSLERVVAGIAAGTVAITLAINLIVEPAIATTLSLKDFAMQAVERAGSQRSIYYFGSLDYAFVFYSGRNMRPVATNDHPALIVGPEEQWPLMPQNFCADYRVVLRSNPTQLDGSGRLLLLAASER